MAPPSPPRPIPPRGSWWRPLLTLGALAAFAAGSAFAPPGPASAQPGKAPGRIAAPELVGGTGWLGTDRPLSLRDLRGKIVILEFWTSC